MNMCSKHYGIATTVSVRRKRWQICNDSTFENTGTDILLSEVLFYRDKKGQALRRPADQYRVILQLGKSKSSPG